MPVHDFQFNPKQIAGGAQPQPQPVIPSKLPDQPKTSEPDPKSFDDANTTVSEDVQDFLVPGFRTMDRGVKEFFSNIMIPSKDGARKVAIRTAGGDKTILFWKQDLESGRIKLPVISVNRTGWQFNPNKFSPPWNPAYRSFANRDATRMVRLPREFSVLMNYTLSVWAERKRDIEYIEYQIITRFNPIAEWSVEDEFMRGNIIGTYEGSTDNSDIDIDANQLAKVRYDVNIKIEGWLPLPGKVVPTILGDIKTLHEFDGTFLDVIGIGEEDNLNHEGFDLSE